MANLEWRIANGEPRDPLLAGQSELRRYRLRYRRNDEPIGMYSDVLSVTVGA